jgi:hypothetical protein
MMKRHWVYSVLAILGVSLAACASEPSTQVCNENYIPTCNQEQMVYTYCDLATGQLVDEPCANGCDQTTNRCIAETCTPETHPATCLDGMTYEVCSNSSKVQGKCLEGQTCQNGSCVTDDSCTDANYPAICIDNMTRGFCYQGKKASQKCDSGCENGACKTAQTEPSKPTPDEPTPSDPDKCDSATFVTKCDTPEYVVTCVNDKIVRTACKNGQMCNSELKTPACKTPAYNDACNPYTFSEMCYGDTQARICDEETRKVVTVDCVKDYGDDYKCDIKEDFYSAGVDAVMCYSKKESCSTEGAESYEYCWAEDSTGYRHFYRETYLCTEFNTGFHTYFYDIEECEGKCGQDTIRYECDFELD